MYTAINGWSKQQIIDHINTNFKGRATVMKENTFNQHPYEACVYRTEDGRKCAAGLFIPDELYKTSMEGTSVKGLLGGEHAEKLAAAFPLNVDGMAHMQSIHDAASNTDDVKNALINFVKSNVSDT